MDHPITIAGIVIPTDNALFLAVLAVHIPAGITCVFAGAAAMLSKKGRGSHTRAGSIYYRSLIVVFLTMTALASMRWAHAYHLFVLGLLSFAAAFAGRRSVRHSSTLRFQGHILGLGASYVLLLIAFYLDNGPSLPLWKSLPPVLYWVLPLATGAPIIAWAVLRHPLAIKERARDNRVLPTGTQGDSASTNQQL
jgi:hypothetical protein